MVNIEQEYKLAKEKYAELDIDTDSALEKLGNISLSLHCWQADDVCGFEKPDSSLSGGGIQVTGNYPGKARNIDELREDLEKVFSLLPGHHRLNLHAIYGEFGNKFVDRDEITVDHFKGWVNWAKKNNLKLDFNPTCFSHPKASSGYTLSSKDKNIRKFWIEHVNRCRVISAFFGRSLKSPCIHNIWIPDGSKDINVDKWTYRQLLKESLDEIFEVKYYPEEMSDSLESKLFGIGSESFVVGSNEFYLSYAIKNDKMVCFDLGHFHPTESIADKISAVLQFSEELLIHVSRSVRWDSDHVVILNDELKNVAEEIVRANLIERVHIALDFFDASMNRVGAYVIGARATLKSLLMALLEPHNKLVEYDNNGNTFARLALLETIKMMPFGTVWDYYCIKNNVIPDKNLIDEIMDYEEKIISKRT
jgi:L-rhamnose isomerase